MLTDDPILDEERRRTWHPIRPAAAPRCCHCNCSIYPHDTYLEIEGMIFCEPCVAYGTKYVDELEV